MASVCATITAPPTIQTNIVTNVNPQLIFATAPDQLLTSASPVVASSCATALPCLLNVTELCPAPVCSTSTSFQNVVQTIPGPVLASTSFVTQLSTQLVTVPGSLSTSCAAALVTTAATTTTTSGTTSTTATTTTTTTTRTSHTRATSSSTVNSSLSTSLIAAADITLPSAVSSATESYSTSIFYSTIVVTTVDSDGRASTSETSIAIPTLLNTSDNASRSKTSTGAIAGGVVGGLVAFIAALIFLWVLRRKGYFPRNQDEQFDEDIWKPAPHSEIVVNRDEDQDEYGTHSVVMSEKEMGVSRHLSLGSMGDRTIGDDSSRQYNQRMSAEATPTGFEWVPNPQSMASIGSHATNDPRRMSQRHSTHNYATYESQQPKRAVSPTSLYGPQRSLSRSSIDHQNFEGRHLSGPYPPLGSNGQYGYISPGPLYQNANRQEEMLPSSDARSHHGRNPSASAYRQENAMGRKFSSRVSPPRVDEDHPQLQAVTKADDLGPGSASTSNSSHSSGLGGTHSMFASAEQFSLPTSSSSQEEVDDKKTLFHPDLRPSLKRNDSVDSCLLPSQFLGARVVNGDGPESVTERPSALSKEVF